VEQKLLGGEPHPTAQFLDGACLSVGSHPFELTLSLDQTVSVAIEHSAAAMSLNIVRRLGPTRREQQHQGGGHIQ
jgi:hypothetical protein